MNHVETARVLAYLASTGRSTNMNGLTTQVWEDALGDLPVEYVEQAAREWVQESPYWPQPSDIREKATEYLLGIPAAPEASWALLEAIEAGTGSLATIDPATREALRLIGGWSTFRQTDDRQWLRKAFVEAYKPARRDQTKPAVVRLRLEAGTTLALGEGTRR
jgi:hypothetical protein